MRHDGVLVSHEVGEAKALAKATGRAGRCATPPCATPFAHACEGATAATKKFLVNVTQRRVQSPLSRCERRTREDAERAAERAERAERLERAERRARPRAESWGPSCSLSDGLWAARASAAQRAPPRAEAGGFIRGVARTRAARGGARARPVARSWGRHFGARGFLQTSKTSESAQRSSLAAPTAGPVRAVRCGSRDVSSPSRPLPLGAAEPPPGLRVARRIGVVPRDRGRSPVRPSQSSNHKPLAPRICQAQTACLAQGRSFLFAPFWTSPSRERGAIGQG